MPNKPHLTYKEANEQELDIIRYDWDSLVEHFGLETLTELTEFRYGKKVTGDLNHFLWFNYFIDDFTHPWYFKANYYNLYKYEVDMDEIKVITR